jgi:hypothetical protein
MKYITTGAPSFFTRVMTEEEATRDMSVHKYYEAGCNVAGCYCSSFRRDKQMAKVHYRDPGTTKINT